MKGPILLHYAMTAAATLLLPLGAEAAPPPAPELTLSVAGQRVEAAWDMVPGATGYTLYYAPYPAAAPIGSRNMGIATEYAIDLPKSAAFFVAVKAGNADGESAYSNILHFTVADRSLATLREGDFWEYLWTTTTTATSSSDTDTDYQAGRLKVTVGSGEIRAGKTIYPISASGDLIGSKVGFAPIWKYVAVDGDKLLGSIDGTTFQTIYGGPANGWRGSGFFAFLPSSRTGTASSSTYAGIYNQTAALSLLRTGSTGGCQYYPEIGDTICEDNYQSYRQWEYHKPGIGPIAYRAEWSAMFSGGGFTTLHSTEEAVELVATSLLAGDGTVFHDSPWKALPGMPSAPSSPSCATYDEKLFVFSSALTASVQIYDPLDASWSTGLPIAGGFIGAFSGMGRIYGYSSSSQSRKLLEYDPATGIARALTTLPFTDLPTGAAVMPSRELLLLRSQKIYARVDVHIYDPESNQWGRGFDLTNVGTIDGFADSIAGVGWHVYYAGGYRSFLGGSTMLKGAGYYDALTGRWMQVTGLATGRTGIIGTALAGNYYALGGSNSDADVPTGVLVNRYDPTVDAWTNLGPLPQARVGFCAAGLGGKIYVVGGYVPGNSTPLGSMVRLQP